MKRIILSAIAVSAAVFANASSTIATFADTAGGSSFVFNTSTNVLTGSWTGTGLTVYTPGFIGGGQVDNAKFDMQGVTLTPVTGGLYAGGSGQINFYTTDLSNPFLVVDFVGATLFNPLNFGASEFSGSIVNLTGPNVPTGLTGEQFSFSFANPTQQGNTISYTSAFTSSAVPEPATMTALGLGAVALMRRRKKA